MHYFVSQSFGSVSQSCPYVRFLDSIVVAYFCDGMAGREGSDNHLQRDTCAFDHRLPAQNGRIDVDALVPVLLRCHTGIIRRGARG